MRTGDIMALSCFVEIPLHYEHTGKRKPDNNFMILRMIMLEQLTIAGGLLFC